MEANIAIELPKPSPPPEQTLLFKHFYTPQNKSRVSMPFYNYSNIFFMAKQIIFSRRVFRLSRSATEGR